MTMRRTCPRGARRFLGQAGDQIGGQLALGQHARAAGGQPHRVPRAAAVDLQEGIEQRRDQHRAQRVRALAAAVGIVVGLRRARTPDAVSS
jgi:hypothetical protein